MPFLEKDAAAILKMGPFVDNGDGSTPESGLSIAQADIQISKNGGAFAQTSDASPTTTHDADGWYPIPLTATDTNTLGRLTVQVTTSGALPVWREYQVVPTTVYNSLVAGSDTLPVDMVQIGGNSVAGNAATLTLKQLDVQNSAGTAVVMKSTGSNGIGLDVAGNGSGIGVVVAAGASATEAVGITSAVGFGLSIIGGGPQAGVYIEGGATGHGMKVLGGVTSGDGIYAAGQTNGDGMTLVGTGASQYDLNAGIQGNLSGSVGSVTGGATAANQTTIIGYLDTEIATIITAVGTTLENHLTDIKGTGFVKDTHSLPQCLTATSVTVSDKTGFSLANGSIVAATFAAGAINAAAIATDAIDADALKADAIAAIQSGLSTHDAAAVKTAIEAGGSSLALIKAVTDALTSAAATKLALSAGTIITGAAAAGTLSTTQMTTNLGEATDDHYNGRILIWTSGVLQNQASDITDYDGGTKMLTFTAVTEAPSAADTFVIV